MNAVATTSTSIQVTFVETLGNLTVYTLKAGPYNREYFVRVLDGNKLDGCTCRNGHCGCEHQAFIAAQLANTTGETAQPKRYTHEYIPVCQCAVCKPERQRRDAIAAEQAAKVAAAKRAAFDQVCHQVRVIELRPIQEKARAQVAARYAELEQQRAIVRAAGAGFSLLK